MSDKAKPGRYDYVAYDADAKAVYAEFKAKVEDIEALMAAKLAQGTSQDAKRARALAITKSEEMFTWVGKAIRDDQIERNGSAPLQT